MQVVYANDTGLGAGYGLFKVSGIDGLGMDSAGVKTTRFVIRRSSDGKYLGRSGWQDAEETLAPDEITADRETGGLLLAVSSNVVNQLDELETCRFSLLQGESTLGVCVLQLAGIVYGHMASGCAVQGVPLVAAVPSPSPVQPVVPDVPVEPEPAIPAPSSGPESLPSMEPNPPKRGHAGLIGALLVVLALAGAGVWWYLQNKANEVAPNTGAQEKSASEVAPATTSPPASFEAQADAASPSPATFSGSNASTVPAASNASKSPKMMVGEFVRKGGTAPEALALSRTLSTENPEGQDAVFLLVEIAAEGGQVEAMLRLAQYYNPLDTAPAGTVQKDAEQAWLWYSKALASGEGAVTNAAQSARDALRQSVAQQAAQGSGSAKALLERMTP